MHVGEFGKHAPIKEERRFQIVPTDLATKPRLYLTGWPCFIFHELGIGERELNLAAKGVKRHLVTGSVQARATVPSHPEHLSTVANIRHTFRALQILNRLRPDEPIVVRLIGDILESPRRSLRQSDGGRPHFASGKKSDLWATTYGTALLNTVETLRTVPITDTGQTGVLIRDALVFLKQAWSRTRWAYAEASSAHNAIQIYHELADTLLRVDPKFLDELVAWVLHWITPSGSLSRTYIEECGHVTWPSGNARIAYAIFQYSPKDPRWRPLFEEALREIEIGVNSADAAFLLHMAQFYWTSP